MLKRLTDIAVSIGFLLVMLPVILLIAITIKIEDRGPLLFRKRSVGRNGITFDVLKFRSMVPEAENRFGRYEAFKGDPRVTRVGKVLRVTALDEIPQFINVLVGQMSIVGPRPLPEAKRPNEIGQYQDIQAVPGFRQRSSVRPGLTGLAQVYLERSSPRQQKFRVDALYVQKASFWLDLRLIAQSALISIRGGWDKPRNRHKAKMNSKPAGTVRQVASTKEMR